MIARVPWLRGVKGDQVLPLITTDTGVLRVQAGPGTGKTFGLGKRVLRLLHPDGLGLDPSSVLVCSFNRVIAKDLRRAIARELEPHQLGTPRVTTVHSLCAAILGAAPRFLLPHEEEAMIYDVRALHPRQKYGGKQLQALRALREHEAGLCSHPDIAAAVKEWLAAHGGALVGDVTRRVQAGLEAGDYDVGQYAHVIVDEFQDLTDTEAYILVTLCAEEGQFVALGDHKQSIYAFRGNDERGLDALPDLVDEPVIDWRMDECQRCRSEIVALANAVMELEGEPLVDVCGPGAEVHRVHFQTPSDEALGIASAAVEAYRTHPDEEHLVLVTRRRWGYDLRNAIRSIDSEIPVETVFSEDVLETWPAREAFIFFEIVGDPDPIALRDWIGYQQHRDGKGFKAPERNARTYAYFRKDYGVLTLDLVRELENDPTAFHGSGKSKVIERLARLRRLLRGMPNGDEPEEIIDYVFNPERWIDFVGENAICAKDDLERLRTEAFRLLKEMQAPSIQALTRQLRSRIATREPLGQGERKAIRIVTLWGAKGLTADYVYIVGLVDEALPGRHDPESSGLDASEHLAEQRRLLYVSLTRAKRALVVSRSTEISRGEVEALGLRKTELGTKWRQKLHRTRFLDDLPREVLPTSVQGSQWRGFS